MIDNFEEVMAKRTDSELAKIVAGPEGNYQSAALDAARKEFDKRNLSTELLVSAKQEFERDQKLMDHRSGIPLGTDLKVLTFMFPGIIQIILSGKLKDDGYDRKASELSRWTLYGFGFYVGLFILISILS
jgi:hypothetical protein